MKIKPRSWLVCIFAILAGFVLLWVTAMLALDFVLLPWFSRNMFKGVPTSLPREIQAVEMIDGPVAGQVRELDLGMPLQTWAVRDEKTPGMVHFYRIDKKRKKGHYSSSVKETDDTTENP